MPNHELSPAAQIFVVQQLAMFERPSAVRKSLKDVFGLNVSLPAIIYYDIQNPNLPGKWRKLFTKSREQFTENLTDIAIANKAFRLRELNRLLDLQKKKAESKQSPGDIRATLEQAAREAGGQYTNRTELTGKDGKAIIPEGPARVVVYLPDNGRPNIEPEKGK